MNEIKKCSVSGIAFTFEKVAYNRLSQYIESLQAAYRNSSERGEIIADIEARIAELILSAQQDAQQVVCLPLIENIIAQLGSAEEISEEQATEPTTETRIARRLYRDLSNHKLGGVCAGLAKYFNTDPVWVRLAIFLPLILIPIANITYHLHWLEELGINLFGIMIVLYIIMWFVVPEAKSARQKLEMEGEAVTAKAIADLQHNATDEQRAKSNLASFVARLGKIAIVCLKAFVALILFPLIFVCVTLILTLFSGLSGIGTMFIELGNLGTLADAISTFGTGLPLLVAGAALVPTIVIIYLLVVLIMGRRPKWWVLICSLIIWILLILGIFTAASKVVTGIHNDEVERILKSDWDDVRITEPIDSTEYNRLMNDPNVPSID